MSGELSTEISRSVPALARLDGALADAQDVVYKSYLERLDSLEVVNPSLEVTDIDVTECGRFFRLERLVTNKDESFIDKLVTVANAVAPLDCTLVTIVESNGSKIAYYMGVVSKRHRQDNDIDRAMRQAGADTFSGAVEGNFSGSTLHELDRNETGDLCNRLFGKPKAIAAVSGVVSMRNDGTADMKAFVQGLENLTNSMRGKSYAIVMIADAVSSGQIREVRQGYELMYSKLSYFSERSMTMTESESHSLSDTQTESIANGISEGVTRSQFRSTNIGYTKGSSSGMSVSGGFGIKGIAHIVVGGYFGKNKSTSTGTTEGSSFADTTQQTKTVSTGRSTSTGSGSERGASIQISEKNRTVQSLLDKIDMYIERLDTCESFGAFDCAAYVLADSREDALSAAGHYNALMRGDDSFVQSSHINSWIPATRVSLTKKNDENPAGKIIKYLNAFSHPEFILDNENRGGVIVRPSSLVSGRELAIQFAFPKKSVTGLAVMEMTPFGRNIPSTEYETLELGTMHYMGRDDPAQTRVTLEVNKLTSHTFITGSTGSGKSNTIYHMLDMLVNDGGTAFLIVEPAKGEYKSVFGGRADVTLYGTNPYKVPNLLKINPFSFPDDIHVLEHIDRIVEVFNACWPMYAAMPAILRESIESAYEQVGWNLRLSKNPGRFPDFNTLLECLPRIIESSGYSGDTSSDYKGALVTRVRSLSRGIHGQIFSGDISAEELFNKNVIADISRIGSQETKALIMGIIVLKLQEFRMSENTGSNCVLRHVTVLEEAHNLLRRTSGEQSQESANLQGKSVEMLTNAIAEMRTYGEGFIISDQSPGLLDMAAIRNTNTKIILCLPDEGDRTLVGKSAGMTDAQIYELSKLEPYVAAVSQSGWPEPVLCKIDEFKGASSYTERYNTDRFEWHDEETEAIKDFIKTAYDVERVKFTYDAKNRIRKWCNETPVREKLLAITDTVFSSARVSMAQKMLLISYITGVEFARISDNHEREELIKRTLTRKYGFKEQDAIIVRVCALFRQNFKPDANLNKAAQDIESNGKGM